MPSILSSSQAPTVAYNLFFDVLYEVQTNMNATSLHGRDLEGLVRVATGLLASRDISRCRREDQAGPRPTDLSAARDFFPSGQYPGYRIPSLIHRLVPHPSFSAHGNRGPTSNGFGACHDQKQQYLAYSTRQLCVRQFGDQASYRQASFLTCLHAIAVVAFPMVYKTL